MHIDRPGAAEVVVAPDLLEQLRPGEHPARVLGQELQQLEFLEGQVEASGRASGPSTWPRLRPARRSGSRPAAESPPGSRRPIASRSRASTSAGPAVCSRKSSAPQSADTAAQPPSVTMTITGPGRSADRSAISTRRARRGHGGRQRSTASGTGPSRHVLAAAGATRTACGSRPSPGRMSADAPRAGQQQYIAQPLPPPAPASSAGTETTNPASTPGSSLSGAAMSEDS